MLTTIHINLIILLSTRFVSQNKIFGVYWFNHSSFFSHVFSITWISSTFLNPKHTATKLLCRLATNAQWFKQLFYTSKTNDIFEVLHNDMKSVCHNLCIFMATSIFNSLVETFYFSLSSSTSISRRALTLKL